MMRLAVHGLMVVAMLLASEVAGVAQTPPIASEPSANFRCALEEQSAWNRLFPPRSGPPRAFFPLTGTLLFSLKVREAELLAADVANSFRDRGRFIIQDREHRLFIIQDGERPSTGTVDPDTGRVEMDLNFILTEDAQDSPLALHFEGRLADGVLRGVARSRTEDEGSELDGGTSKALLLLFCRKQFTDASVTARFHIDPFDNITPLAHSIQPGSPPNNFLGLSADFVVETVTRRGRTIQELPLPDPRLVFDGPAREEAEFDVVVPFSNSIRAVRIRGADGSVKALVNITDEVRFFCAGQGSQECDSEAGSPVREAPEFTPLLLEEPQLSPMEAQALTEALPSAALPVSPRVAGNEWVVSSNPNDRQPDIGLDRNGNAVVVWRRGFRDVMVAGFSNEGAPLFGPVQVNQAPAIASIFTHRPAVARAPDGQFVVAWGRIDFVSSRPGLVVQVPLIFARVFDASGNPLSPETLVATDLLPDTWVDVAMSASHEFLVTWHTFPPGGRSDTVFARRFGPGAIPRRDSFRVSSASGLHAVFPSVAMDDAGQAVIAWWQAPSLVPPFPRPGSPATPRVGFQRFGASGGKLGGIDVVIPNLVGIPEGVPDVTMNPATGDFVLVGRTTEGEIWAQIFAFGAGKAIADEFPANARQKGLQQRPAVARNRRGEFLVAWLDEAPAEGTGEPARPIAAELFDPLTVPLDVDFTASTKTAPDTRFQDSAGTRNPDFGVLDAFAFRVGSSDDRFVLTWQSPEGIAAQVITSGRVPCPPGENCEMSVPLRLSGSPADRLDVMLLPGVLTDDTGKRRPEFHLFASEAEFARAAVGLFVNGFVSNEVIKLNTTKLNLYYAMEMGSGRDTCGISPGFRTDQQYLFVDSVGVILNGRDIADAGCAHGKVFSVIRPSGSDRSYVVFVHEFSHTAFDLADEYDCTGEGKFTSRFESSPFPNIFNGEASCRSKSANPDGCRALADCLRPLTNSFWWRADPDPDVMAGTGIHFQADCVRNVRHRFAALP